MADFKTGMASWFFPLDRKSNPSWYAFNASNESVVACSTGTECFCKDSPDSPNLRLKLATARSIPGKTSSFRGSVTLSVARTPPSLHESASRYNT